MIVLGECKPSARLPTPCDNYAPATKVKALSEAAACPSVYAAVTVLLSLCLSVPYP